MTFFLCVASTAALSPSAFAIEAISQGPGVPPGATLPRPQITIGDVSLPEENTMHVQSSRIGLGNDGTVYLIARVAHGASWLMRLSKKGQAERLFMYRGRPYLLDHSGRLYGFEPSFWTELRAKMPYITMRQLKALPLSVATGLGLTVLAFVDQTFTGLVNVPSVELSTAFWAGFLGFYGFDLTRIIFLKKVRALTDGGNFFTERIATRVIRLEENPHHDDWIVTTGNRKSQKEENLSQMLSEAQRSLNCIDYLARLITH